MEIITFVMKILSGGLGFAGGCVVIYGLWTGGQAVRDHQGPAMMQALGTIAGGAMMLAAAFGLTKLDLSWITVS